MISMRDLITGDADAARPLSAVNRCRGAASTSNATRLHPSPVNDVALVRYRSTIIRRKKQDEACNLLSSQTPLERLACHDLGLVFRRPPPAALALRQNRAGQDAVYTNVGFPELVGHRSRQTYDCRFARYVSGHAG